ncbi:MAG: hypothetical protein KatS3mg068_0394 [Candidatus Sericytochromatia bacterium]|nr:MAG: hypothetical protein KatS3mg068_0394 [Candidatus Sericytochromatia bacterium]
MSVNGANNSIGKVDLKEVSRNASTAPTPIEKEIANKLKEGVKEVIKDVSNFMKTPQGKVITTGVLITPIALPIGMGMVLGGAAYSAFKALDDNKEKLKNTGEHLKEGAKEAAKKVKENVDDLKDAAANGAIAGAVVGTAIAGPLGTVPGAVTGAAASTAAEALQKAIKKDK